MTRCALWSVNCKLWPKVVATELMFHASSFMVPATWNPKPNTNGRLSRSKTWLIKIESVIIGS